MNCSIIKGLYRILYNSFSYIQLVILLRRMKLKKKIKIKNNINFIIYILVAIFLALIFLFRYINKKVSPLLLDYAEIESRKLSSIIVSKAINNEIAKELTVENLFIITKSDEGEIRTIDFNPVLVNQLLLKATTAVQTNLKYLEDGDIDKLELGENTLINYDPDNLREGIFYKVPSGIIFSNALLANLGPKIPVRFSLIGDIIANIVTNVTNYGINNALIDVKMSLKLNQKVILPISTRNISVEVTVPIALKVIQGVVPEYYFNGFSTNSEVFTLPIE